MSHRYKVKLKPIRRLWILKGTKFLPLAEEELTLNYPFSDQGLAVGVTYKINARDEHGYWTRPTLFHLGERGEWISGAFVPSPKDGGGSKDVRKRGETR